MSGSRIGVASGGTWDIHAHAVPGNVRNPNVLRDFGMTTDGRVLTLGAERLMLPNLLDGKWLWEQEQRPADNVVLSVPPALLRYDLQGDELGAWTRLLNDGIEELCRSNERLWGLAYLPMHDPLLAVREVESRGGTPWLGYVIGTSIGDLALDDPALDPVYEALSVKNALVFVHPLRSPDTRLNRYYLENVLGNPYETGLAMASLVLSGKLMRFPSIRFCFAHAGGVAPQLIGRWQRGFGTQRPGLEHLSVDPLEAAKNLYVDCVAHHPLALQTAIGVFGLDHVLPGTDSPFPMGQSLSSALHGLPEEQKISILCRHAPRLIQESNLCME